jgi:hypothetical protein
VDRADEPADAAGAPGRASGSTGQLPTTSARGQVSWRPSSSLLECVTATTQYDLRLLNRFWR